MKKTLTLFLFLVIINHSSLFAQAWHTDGLTAYYSFNNRSLSDSSQSQQHLTDSVNIAAATDRHGNVNRAISFKDGSGYLSGTSKHLPDSVEQRSYSIWININDTTEPVAFVFFYGRSVQGRGMGLGITAKRRLFFSGFLSNIETSYSVPLHQWMHIGLTFDGDTAKIYFNGILTNITLVNGAWFTENTRPELNIGYLGTFNNNTGFEDVDLFNGAVDDFRVYNRELSDSEMQNLAQDDFNTVSIEETAWNTAIHLFPNPVKDVLQIASATKINQATVFNAQGQKIMQLSTPTNEIDTRNLPVGTYILKLDTENGLQNLTFIKR